MAKSDFPTGKFAIVNNPHQRWGKMIREFAIFDSLFMRVQVTFTKSEDKDFDIYGFQQALKQYGIDYEKILKIADKN